MKQDGEPVDILIAPNLEGADRALTTGNYTQAVGFLNGIPEGVLGDAQRLTAEKAITYEDESSPEQFLRTLRIMEGLLTLEAGLQIPSQPDRFRLFTATEKDLNTYWAKYSKIKSLYDQGDRRFRRHQTALSLYDLDAVAHISFLHSYVTVHRLRGPHDEHIKARSNKQLQLTMNLFHFIQRKSSQSPI